MIVKFIFIFSTLPCLGHTFPQWSYHFCRWSQHFPLFHWAKPTMKASTSNGDDSRSLSLPVARSFWSKRDSRNSWRFVMGSSKRFLDETTDLLVLSRKQLLSLSLLGNDNYYSLCMVGITLHGLLSSGNWRNAVDRVIPPFPNSSVPLFQDYHFVPEDTGLNGEFQGIRWDNIEYVAISNMCIWLYTFICIYNSYLIY